MTSFIKDEISRSVKVEIYEATLLCLILNKPLVFVVPKNFGARVPPVGPPYLAGRNRGGLRLAS